jgi:CRP-like cAMP-binding protein
VIELLAGDLQPHDFPAGTVAMCEGEVGDLFHVIVTGTAALVTRRLAADSPADPDAPGPA